MSSDNKYNDEPVSYCKACLSLAIKTGDGESTHCDVCGCSSVGRVNIDQWSGMFADRYGFDYLTGKVFEDEKCKHCEYKNRCK